MSDFRSQAAEYIKAREGFRAEAYDDETKKTVKPGDKLIGKLTIGYGFTEGVKVGDRMSVKEADEKIKKVLEPFARAVEKNIKVDVTDKQKVAMTSLAYNIGAEAFAESTLVKRLNAGDVRGAADEFLRWNIDNGKVVKGLTNRRKVEREMFVADIQGQPPYTEPGQQLGTQVAQGDEKKKVSNKSQPKPKTASRSPLTKT